MKIKLSIIIVIFLIFNATTLFAQENITIVKEEFKTDNKHFFKAWKNIKFANKQFSKNTSRGYLLALEYYLYAYDYNPPELNYQIGISYLNSIYKFSALPFLQNAFEKKPNVSKDILWEQYNYMFDEAIASINEYENKLI